MAGDPQDTTTKGTLKPFFTTGCSGAMFEVLNRGSGEPLRTEERAAAYLAGGILTNGYQCGQVWGAALAAGAECNRRYGSGPAVQAMAVDAAGRLVDAFEAQTGHVDCFDLTETDWDKRAAVTRYMLTGGGVRCYRMLKAYIPEAFTQIRDATAGTPPTAPEPPVSCAAMMAERLGLSERQTVMAAGLAGGIGLRGGGCGALGTAVWAVGLQAGDDSKIDFRSPRVSAVIERFLEATGYEFECSGVVGRRFRDLEDHAAHLRDGGCEDLMETLADD